MKKNLKTCIEQQSFGTPICLLDMNDYDRIKADGLAPDLLHNRSAHMTAAWKFSDRTAVRMALSADLSAYRYLTFSVFAVNGSGGSLNLRMEAAGEPNGACGYATTLPICRNGWNDFRIELPFMEAIGNPQGWDTVRGVVLDCAVGGQANSTDTVLYIDNFFAWDGLAPQCYVKMPELKGAALFSKTACHAIVDRRRIPVSPDSHPNARPFDLNGRLWLPMGPIAAVIAHKAVADNKAETLSFTYRRRAFVFYGNSDRYLENGEEKQLSFRPAVREGNLFFPADYLCEFFHWRQIFTHPNGVILLSNRKNAFEQGRDDFILTALNAELTFAQPTGADILNDLHKKITNPEKGRLLLLPEEWMVQRKAAKTDADFKTLLDSVKLRFGISSEAYKAESAIKENDTLQKAEWQEAASRCASMSALYRLTGDKKYALRVFEECKAVANWSAWQTGLLPIEILAPLSEALAFAYDWCHSAWSEAEKALLERALLRGTLRPAVEYYNGKKQITKLGSSLSAQIDCAFTASSLALADIYPETAARILAHSVRHISASMEAYAPDGGFGEGLSAWEKATRSLVLTVAMLQSACGKDYGLSNASGFASTARFAIAAETENGAWNYNGEQPASLNTAVFGWFSQRYGNPTPAWIRHRDLLSGKKEVDILDLVWYAPLDRALIPELPLDAIYRKAGLVMLRSGWEKNATLLGLHGGSNHAYGIELDAGSFLLEMGGERFFLEPDGDLPRAMLHRAQGHNTLTVGNVAERLLDQNADALVPLIEARSVAQKAYAVADMSSISDAVIKGKRGVLLTNNRSVAVVQDEFSFEAPTEITWRAYTKADIAHIGARTLILEQNGVSLLCKLSGAGGARFAVSEIGETPFRCVTVRAEAKEKLRMAVAFRLFAPEDDRNQAIYDLSPISSWEL